MEWTYEYVSTKGRKKCRITVSVKGGGQKPFFHSPGTRGKCATNFSALYFILTPHAPPTIRQPIVLKKSQIFLLKNSMHSKKNKV